MTSTITSLRHLLFQFNMDVDSIPYHFYIQQRNVEPTLLRHTKSHYITVKPLASLNADVWLHCNEFRVP